MSDELKDGQPCSHPGCLNHVSHPCEGCGRIAGKKMSEELKPCSPFYWAELYCRELVSHEGTLMELLNLLSYDRLKNPDYLVTGLIRQENVEYRLKMIKKMRQEAIDAWNTRPAEPRCDRCKHGEKHYHRYYCYKLDVSFEPNFYCKHFEPFEKIE